MTFNPNLFQDTPVIGILRGFPSESIGPIIEACSHGGLQNIEITMNSSEPSKQIREAVRLAQGKMNVGAGTVTSLALLEDALAAGASFIVTPHLQRQVIQQCVRGAIPVFPGALTPTEIHEASELGAAMVKIFPADSLGPGYIKALRGPFPSIKLMPTGGVTLANLPAWKKAGANAFGVGSPLFDPVQIKAKNWSWLAERCRQFVEACKLGVSG